MDDLNRGEQPEETDIPDEPAEERLQEELATPREIAAMPVKERTETLEAMPTEEAVDLLHEIPDVQGADFVEQMSALAAAAIVQSMPSNERADLLAVMNEEKAESILRELPDETQQQVRALIQYSPDTAGGLMITEFLSFEEDATIRDLLNDMQDKTNDYSQYDIQYVYVTTETGGLVGVLRLRDLLLTPPGRKICDIMIQKPLFVRATAELEELQELFKQKPFFGFPVVDESGVLVGVVKHSDVVARTEQTTNENFLKLLGITGGEELRSLPWYQRSAKRLSWLSVNIGLNVLAASVIAVYQDTLSAVIALAVFLPIISDMSGCSGSQAVGVSMRELSLNLIRPSDMFRVMRQEIFVGAINGIALGFLLSMVAFLWKGNVYLGVVVGGAMALNTVVAVGIGGCVPLLLKALKQDPALASGPILTTLTDMCGFFFVLSFATAFLDKLM